MSGVIEPAADVGPEQPSEQWALGYLDEVPADPVAAAKFGVGPAAKILQLATEHDTSLKARRANQGLRIFSLRAWPERYSGWPRCLVREGAWRHRQKPDGFCVVSIAKYPQDHLGPARRRVP